MACMLLFQREPFWIRTTCHYLLSRQIWPGPNSDSQFTRNETNLSSYHPHRHIKEHYDGKLNFNETDMRPEELEFHYFKYVRTTITNCFKEYES